MFIINYLSFGVEFGVEGIKIGDFGWKMFWTYKSSTRTGDNSLRARYSVTTLLVLGVLGIRGRSGWFQTDYFDVFKLSKPLVT